MTRTRLILCLLIAAGFGGLAVRAVVPAYGFNHNDFSDPYCASWLWRHGQNPYDVAAATAISREKAHSGLKVVPVYPPTAYVLLAPLTFLPWKLANLLWAVFGSAAVSWMAYSLPKLVGFSFLEDRAWLLAACVFCAAPLHTALHAANSAAIAVSLCSLVVFLATRQQDRWAGVVLAIAVCLKPQLGIWVFAIYGLRHRWGMIVPACAISAVISAVALLRMPLSLPGLLQNYGANLQFWFKPGGMNDFSTANPFRFQLLNLQVVFEPWVHSVLAANVLAWTIFGIGLVGWLWAMRRREYDELLALSSLLMLGMLPVYHRSYDGAVALLGLAWLLSEYRTLRRLFYAAVLPVAVLALPPLSLIVNILGKAGEQYPRGLIAAVSAFACFAFALELMLALHIDLKATKNSGVIDRNLAVTVEAARPETEGALVAHP